MLDPKRMMYDEENHRLVYDSGVGGGAALDKELGQELAKIQKSREYQGHPIEQVFVLFDDGETAKYNADRMVYLGLVAMHGDHEIPSDVTFTPRSDFGIG